MHVHGIKMPHYNIVYLIIDNSSDVQQFDQINNRATAKLGITGFLWGEIHRCTSDQWIPFKLP